MDEKLPAADLPPRVLWFAPWRWFPWMKPWQKWSLVIALPLAYIESPVPVVVAMDATGCLEQWPYVANTVYVPIVLTADRIDIVAQFYEVQFDWLATLMD